MAISNKTADRLIASDANVQIVGDNGQAVNVRFIKRDRSYIEYMDINAGFEGKLHRDDITLA